MSAPSMATIRARFGELFTHRYGDVEAPSKRLRKALVQLDNAWNWDQEAAIEVCSILDGYGWEEIRNRDGELVCSYVNTGDTYNTTVLVYKSGSIRIGCWGDVVERRTDID